MQNGQKSLSKVRFWFLRQVFFWGLVCIEKWSQNFDSGARSAKWLKRGILSILGVPKMTLRVPESKLQGFFQLLIFQRALMTTLIKIVMSVLLRCLEGYQSRKITLYMHSCNKMAILSTIYLLERFRSGQFSRALQDVCCKTIFVVRLFFV